MVNFTSEFEEKTLEELQDLMEKLKVEENIRDYENNRNSDMTYDDYKTVMGLKKMYDLAKLSFTLLSCIDSNNLKLVNESNDYDDYCQKIDFDNEGIYKLYESEYIWFKNLIKEINIIKEDYKDD